eukprot:1894734-Amphidinium_carterae.3
MQVKLPAKKIAHEAIHSNTKAVDPSGTTFGAVRLWRRDVGHSCNARRRGDELTTTWVLRTWNPLIAVAASQAVTQDPLEEAAQGQGKPCQG